MKGVQRIEAMAGEDDPKIFVIGLNRCATTSLHTLFEKSFIPSLHWRDANGQNLMKAFMVNIALGLKPFHGFDGFVAFSDLSFIGSDLVLEGARFFRDLHRHYPDAYFILNTRPVDTWIASRSHHANGTFLSKSMQASGHSHDEVQGLWREMALAHEAEVKDYFKDNPRFLHFDIVNDDAQKIADLVQEDYAIDVTKWKLSNQGPGPRPAAATKTLTPARPAEVGRVPKPNSAPQGPQHH
ncbi:sulfotransferase [uncultured Aliiroseovarius sp.]|uniref:sulfotransferase n=1 Tax=uncultured Aliiroseovarius sp. TaxID=1658783 RepID=UPI0026342BB0|nr:sulfotransferase [uncultured Aliiroseovarius sp.]